MLLRKTVIKLTVVQFSNETLSDRRQLECGPMPNVMAALQNTGVPSVQRRKVWLHGAAIMTSECAAS